MVIEQMTSSDAGGPAKLQQYPVVNWECREKYRGVQVMREGGPMRQDGSALDTTAKLAN